MALSFHTEAMPAENSLCKRCRLAGICEFSLHHGSGMCASGAYELTTLSYRQNADRGNKNSWVPAGVGFGALSVSALRFDSFLAVVAAEALEVCLLVKLIFITCNGAQILWYWPWP